MYNVSFAKDRQDCDRHPLMKRVHVQTSPYHLFFSASNRFCKSSKPSLELLAWSYVELEVGISGKLKSSTLPPACVGRAESVILMYSEK